MVKRGAKLEDGESIKEVIARQNTWSNSTKSAIVAAYKKYAVINGLTWANALSALESARL